MSENFIPFHKPFINNKIVDNVVDAVKSGWWTMGPRVLEFENEFGSFIDRPSVAVNSWTAAAHLALEAIGLKPGDEVIVPAITFTATAEVVCYFNAKPVIVDIDPLDGNISPAEIEKHITPKTKAVIPVHYGGFSAQIDEIYSICKDRNIRVIEDAAHAIPTYFDGKLIGETGDIVTYSFYVTKPLAAGEGGLIATKDDKIIDRVKKMRLHGIDNDSWKRYTKEGSWYYEIISAGFKYNWTDIQAAIALEQLKLTYSLWEMRKEIAHKYNKAFKPLRHFRIPMEREKSLSAWHLYPLRLNIEMLTINRNEFVDEIIEKGIGASVHFIPLYRHPYYRSLLNLKETQFPNSEKFYETVLSLPIWPGMSNEQVDRVIEIVLDTSKKYLK